ncbi:Plasmodium exported protein, unknown function [Plasmodium gonderi]|uniref:Pv-fam-d protein n=1 Tax=Plasmodium gonderi TaxID=77519 RepID=A0A1Y1JJP7_PLAGO|nr:Plasmodium exported protein, unknown function [Plasmodium gonderi]GAW82726.1 Plasmodium exported protein, unknown function [Plasmodium gonderi]
MKERINRCLRLFTKIFICSILIWIWQHLEGLPSFGKSCQAKNKRNVAEGLRTSGLLKEEDTIVNPKQTDSSSKEKYVDNSENNEKTLVKQLSLLLKDKYIQKRIHKLLKDKKFQKKLNAVNENTKVQNPPSQTRVKKNCEELFSKPFPSNNYEQFPDSQETNSNYNKHPNTRNSNFNHSNYPNTRNSNFNHSNYPNTRNSNFNHNKYPNTRNSNFNHSKYPNTRNSNFNHSKYPNTCNSNNNCDSFSSSRNLNSKYGEFQNLDYSNDSCHTFPHSPDSNVNSFEQFNNQQFAYDHEKSSTSMKRKYNLKRNGAQQNYDDIFKEPHKLFDIEENFKRQYNALKEEDDFVKQFNTLKEKGYFKSAINGSKHYTNSKSRHTPSVIDNTNDRFDMLNRKPNYKETCEIKPDSRLKIEEELMKKEYVKAKKAKKANEKKLSLRNFLRKLDAMFEFEMIHSMKIKNSNKYSSKSTVVGRTMSHCLKKYRLFFPLMLNVVTVLILASLKYEISASIFCIVGLIMVVYYEIKLNKIKQMHKMFKKFNYRFKAMPKSRN